MANPTTPATPLSDAQLLDIYMSIDCGQLAIRWKCSVNKVYQQINRNQKQIVAYAKKRLHQRDVHLHTLSAHTAKQHLELSYSQLVDRMKELEKSASETSYLFKLHDRFNRANT